MFLRELRLKDLEKKVDFQQEQIFTLQSELRAVKCLVEVLSEKAVDQKENDFMDKFLNKEGLYDYQAYKKGLIEREAEQWQE